MPLLILPPIRKLTVFPMQSKESRGFCRKFDARELYYTAIEKGVTVPESKKDALKAWLRASAELTFGHPVESRDSNHDELIMSNEPQIGAPIEATITLLWQRKIQDDDKNRSFASVEVRVTSGERKLLEGPYVLIVP